MKIEEPCGTRTRLPLYRKNNLVRKSVIYYLMVNKRPSKYIVFQIKRSSRKELYNNSMCFDTRVVSPLLWIYPFVNLILRIQMFRIYVYVRYII